MEWTVHELAERAGISGRTLRHYHQIGLLDPDRVGSNGYRYYGPDAVSRLQRILLLRETGMPLADIADVLDVPTTPEVEVQALTGHLEHLARERDFCHHFSPHDAEQEWGSDDITAVLEGVRSHAVGDARVADFHADLTEPNAAEQVIDAAVSEFGHVDALVCNQALSGSDGPIGELSAADLDQHWAVDARASILLAQSFATHHVPGTPASIVFLTSGQDLGPMPGEVAYAAAKAAIAGVTTTIADQLADDGIRVNTINPGPVDTGYLTDDMWQFVKPMFPFGRYGQPDDPARLIAWLVTDEASWLTGQIINTEGGFGRWRPRGS